MDDAKTDIASLVNLLVTSLVDDPEAVEVTSAENEDGSLAIEASVAAEDVGKVIGRQGHTIKAIRTLARAAASKDDRHVDVEVLG